MPNRAHHSTYTNMWSTSVVLHGILDATLERYITKTSSSLSYSFISVKIGGTSCWNLAPTTLEYIKEFIVDPLVLRISDEPVNRRSTFGS
jgi:hypothetical protein